MLMKVSILIIFSMAFVTSRNHSPKFRIPFGQPAGWLVGNEAFNPGDFPFMVRLEITQDIVINGTGYEKTKRCGAAIINADIVITAGHCVYGAKRSEITVQGGMVNTAMEEKSSQLRWLLGYVVHEDFMTSPYIDNDIALLFLAEPFHITKFVKPIDLPTQGYYPMGTEATTFGWGLDENGDKPQWLQRTNLSVIADQICQSFSLNEISDNMLCAINQGVSTICKGDSGGPLVYENKIIGITSWIMSLEQLDNGKISCNTDYPAVFVNVYDYLYWIEDTIKEFRKGI